MFVLGLRQVSSLIESLLELAHLHWRVPDYSSILAIFMQPTNVGVDGGLEQLLQPSFANGTTTVAENPRNQNLIRWS